MRGPPVRLRDLTSKERSAVEVLARSRWNHYAPPDALMLSEFDAIQT